MKILTVIGARPQFIKAAVISRLVERDSSLNEIIVHTGQHFDQNMSDVFFSELDIPKPKYNLSINGKSHGEMTGLMMIEIEKIVNKENPDWVLVYGDTNSTIAGALVAAKLNIKLAHVEAGLRSFNDEMPEEINRIVTDRLSNILFCPTDQAVRNLSNEGFENFHEKEIVRTGDIMYDAALYASSLVTTRLFNSFPKDFILCTIHRAENTNNEEKLLTIFESLNEIGKEFKILLPLHPRTNLKLSDITPEFKEKYSYINFVSPLGYLEMIGALKRCQFVITDSGGVQKEAYFFKKMCLTLRDQTEWTELVENGYNILCKINKNEITEKCKSIASQKKIFKEHLYGDGHTGEIILNHLKKI